MSSDCWRFTNPLAADFPPVKCAEVCNTMWTTCPYDVDVADPRCQLEPTSKIGILWLWDHKTSREILQVCLSTWKLTAVSRGQKTVHDIPTGTDMGIRTPFTSSTSSVNAVQVLTIHRQLNCGQNNCGDLICHTSVGGKRQPFGKPLAVLKTDVAGVYGEAIIFQNRPAPRAPAELSSQLAPVALTQTHTHTHTHMVTMAPK